VKAFKFCHRGRSCRQGCNLEWSAYFLSALIRHSANETDGIDPAITIVKAQNKLELHQYQEEIKPDDKTDGHFEPLNCTSGVLLCFRT
jgi:hypothetical protein